MAALIKVDDADNGYTGGPKELERRGCVKSETYQGAATNYE